MNMNKNKWKMFNDVFRIYEDKDLFEKGNLKTIPCRVFWNIDTGEYKLFASKYVEKNGSDTIIKLLEESK